MGGKIFCPLSVYRENIKRFLTDLRRKFQPFFLDNSIVINQDFKTWKIKDYLYILTFPSTEKANIHVTLKSRQYDILYIWIDIIRDFPPIEWFLFFADGYIAFALYMSNDFSIMFKISVIERKITLSSYRRQMEINEYKM